MSQFFSPSANLLSRCLHWPAVKTNTEATQGEMEAQSHFLLDPFTQLLITGALKPSVKGPCDFKMRHCSKEETEGGSQISSHSLPLTSRRCAWMFLPTAELAAVTSAAVSVCRLRCWRHLLEVVHGHIRRNVTAQRVLWLKRSTSLQPWMWPDYLTAGPRELTQACTSM